MRVYRCVSAREITNMYKGENERIPLVKGENTHTYDDKESYIHFFRYSQSAIKRKDDPMWATTSALDRYVMIMTANIPNKILEKYMGYGIYNSSDDFFGKSNEDAVKVKNPGYIPIPEYAIPESEFSKDYIVEINTFIDPKLKNDEKEYKKYITLLDVLYGEFKNYKKVTEYLEKKNLQELLRVKDDDRNEDQIRKDELNEMIEIFSQEDFLRGE